MGEDCDIPSAPEMQQKQEDEQWELWKPTPQIVWKRQNPCQGRRFILNSTESKT